MTEDFQDGYRQGVEYGYLQGMENGYRQGMDDCLSRLEKAASSIHSEGYTIQQLLKESIRLRRQEES